MQRTPVITVVLSTQQAWAYAQFLKRVGLDDYRRLAQDLEEAYTMLSAGEAIRQELRQAGARASHPAAKEGSSRVFLP